jgi:hypothetical protein
MKPQAASAPLEAGADFEQLKPYSLRGGVSELSFSERMQTKEHQHLVGKRMQLKAKGIGPITMAGKPLAVKIALKLLDPILALSSMIVVGKDFFGSARSVGNDEAQVGAQRTDFDFDDNSSLFGPASGAVSEAIENSNRLAAAGVLAFGPPKPALGCSLKHRVGADADRIENLERFQGCVDFWSGRAGIGAIADLALGKASLKDGNQPFKLTAYTR